MFIEQASGKICQFLFFGGKSSYPISYHSADIHIIYVCIGNENFLYITIKREGWTGVVETEISVLLCC